MLGEASRMIFDVVNNSSNQLVSRNLRFTKTMKQKSKELEL